MESISRELHDSLRSEYLQHDVAGVMQAVLRVQRDPGFPPLRERFVREGRVQEGGEQIEAIAQVLLEEIDREVSREREEGLGSSFYQVAEAIKKKFNPAVGEIYLETVLPNDIVEGARAALRTDAPEDVRARLSDAMVERYKNELVRVEKGRRGLLYVLQQHSFFPIKNAVLLSQALTRLHDVIRKDYRYLSVKPRFFAIPHLSELRTVVQAEGGGERPAKVYRLFDSYLTEGEEPSVIQQLQVRFALSRLFDYLRKSSILTPELSQELWGEVVEVWTYRPRSSLTVRARRILEETLRDVNRDRRAISRKLAATFIAEYRSAEEQMRTLARQISIQLADTAEFLRYFERDTSRPAELGEEKVRIAEEQIAGLEGVFDLSQHQEAAFSRSYDELEKSALAVPPSVTPEQIIRWLEIYSIIFSNIEFIEDTGESLDLAPMRTDISSLSAYHLIHNVSTLRVFIERNLTVRDEEKAEHFRRFNEALRIKLQSLMGGKRAAEMGIREMIEELGFINNKRVQYLVAETLKGFESLAEAFEAVAEGYFIKDRDAVVRESRNLYEDICSQCLRNFIYRPSRPRRASIAAVVASAASGGLASRVLAAARQLFRR